MCQVKGGHHHDSKERERNVPCPQTKMLMVPPVGSDNFRSIPTYCMVGQASMFRQRRIFLFVKKKRFLVLL